MDHPSGSKTGTPAWQWALALAAVALFVFRYGYGFGYSDQDEFLPLVGFLLDSDLFQNDWFVMMQADGFSIRWPVALLVALPGTFLPVWAVVLGLHLLTGVGSALAVAKLSYRVFGNAAAAIGSVMAVFVVTTRFNPGGNDILHAMLVPSSIAWCLILWAIVMMHERRAFASGTLLGAATLFHPLLGLQTGSLLLLIGLLLPNWPWSAWRRQALPYAVFLIPLVFLLSSIGSSTQEATYILTHVRAPHHYLPETFAPQSWGYLAVLLVTSAALIGFDRFPESLRTVGTDDRLQLTRWDRAVLGRMLLVPAVVLVLSLTLTTWPLEWGTAQRLQPWAASPLIRVLAAATVAGYAASWIFSRWSGPVPASKTMLVRRGNNASPFLALVLLFFAFSGKGGDIRGTSSSNQELFDWARENARDNAVFVIPPSMTGFQYGTKHAQYVSFKSFPFAPEPTLEWRNRLNQIAPTSDLPGGTAMLERLDSAYVAQRVADMRSFTAEAIVDYFVRPVPDPGNWQESLTPEWCDEQWCVYWAGRILTQPVRPPAS